MDEAANDYRVSKDHFARIKFSCFGLGGKIYAENFCKPVKQLFDNMVTLSAEVVTPLMVGDDQSDLEKQFSRWCGKIMAWAKMQSGDHKHEDQECCGGTSCSSGEGM